MYDASGINWFFSFCSLDTSWDMVHDLIILLSDLIKPVLLNSSKETFVEYYKTFYLKCLFSGYFILCITKKNIFVYVRLLYKRFI